MHLYCFYLQANELARYRFYFRALNHIQVIYGTSLNRGSDFVLADYKYFPLLLNKSTTYILLNFTEIPKNSRDNYVILNKPSCEQIVTLIKSLYIKSCKKILALPSYKKDLIYVTKDNLYGCMTRIDKIYRNICLSIIGDSLQLVNQVKLLFSTNSIELLNVVKPNSTCYLLAKKHLVNLYCNQEKVLIKKKL